MKKLFLIAMAALAVCGAANGALADGMPGEGVPVADACCQTEWSGLYIAGSVGYDFSNTEFGHTFEQGAYNDTSHSDISGDGVTGTIAVGYDKQLSSGIVAGVFADYTFGERDGDGIRSYPTTPTLERFSLELDDVWAIGGRVGLAHSCCTLWYLTAGYTEADLTLSDARGHLDKDLQGYFLGGGVEQNIRDALFLKLEYRYSDYGSETLYEDAEGCCYERFDTETDIHSIRLGVAYKFDFRREEAAAPLK